MKEALYYKVFDEKEKKVQCFLCPHHCIIKPESPGICKARKNVDGRLYSLIYGRYSSSHLDPIEKKPLFHFYPGSAILSFGSLGCNLACSFCQNWSISQVDAEIMNDKEIKIISQEMSPEKAVELALKFKDRDNIGIAYTYNEPFIWYEFILDTAKIAKESGLKNILVTNGYVEEEPLRQILPYIDAMNVDVKSMKPEFYTRVCHGKLEYVLKTCEIAVKECFIEITNLVIPTLNDSREDFEKLTGWVAEKLGKGVPLHFSRYHPDFQMNISATPTQTLEMARDIAMKKLDYVYVGNVWNARWENTVCPGCKAEVIQRRGFDITEYNLTPDNKCNKCFTSVNIVGSFKASSMFK